MRYLILLPVIFLGLLSAQVKVTYTPLPMSFLKPYGVSSLGIGNVEACNGSDLEFAFSPQRLRQEILDIDGFTKLVSLDLAKAVIEDNIGKTKTSKIVRWSGYALLGVPALGGVRFISDHAQWVQILSTGAGVTMQVRDSLGSRIRDPAKLYANDFSGPVIIKPHSCMETRTVFAAKMKSPKVIKFTIQP